MQKVTNFNNLIAGALAGNYNHGEPWMLYVGAMELEIRAARPGANETVELDCIRTSDRAPQTVILQDAEAQQKLVSIAETFCHTYEEICDWACV